jgi:hypothetical protein
MAIEGIHSSLVLQISLFNVTTDYVPFINMV